MMQKPLYRVLCFLAIFLLLFFYASFVFSIKGFRFGRMRALYHVQDNSLDVIFLGASGFNHGASPLLMWEAEGFTSYVNAVAGQQANMMYYYFLESLKNQQPQVVVLDAYRLPEFIPFLIHEEQDLRSIASMRWSPNKLSAILDITGGSNFDSVISVLFPLFRYHNRWKDLSLGDFGVSRVLSIEDPESDESTRLTSQRITFETKSINLPDDFMAPTDFAASLHPESVKYFEMIIDECQKRGIGVVLLSFPRISGSDYPQHLAIQAFADQQGVLFVDYNLQDYLLEFELDPEQDWFDGGHLNTCGSKKFANHLADLLKENFDLPDRRSDPEFQQWSENAETLLQEIAVNCHED